MEVPNLMRSVRIAAAANVTSMSAPPAPAHGRPRRVDARLLRLHDLLDRASRIARLDRHAVHLASSLSLSRHYRYRRASSPRAPTSFAEGSPPPYRGSVRITLRSSLLVALALLAMLAFEAGWRPSVAVAQAPPL